MRRPVRIDRTGPGGRGRHGESRQGHHHLRRHRGHPHAVDVAPSAGDSRRDRRTCRRRGRGGRRDRAPARARPRNRQARPDTGSLRPLPPAHQAGDRRGREHHHRRQSLHAGRRADETGGRVQAGGSVPQHGLDQFRPLPHARPLQGVQVRLGETDARGHARPRLPQQLQGHRVYS